MKTQIMAGAAAIALALSMDVATAAQISDGSTPGYLQQQIEPCNEPSYSIGAGEVHIGDGSSPRYHAPVFSGVTW
jgi:hypothetical protein